MQNEFSGVFSGEHGAHLCDESVFSEIEELEKGGFCRILRAKRHGQWWSLKCLKEEYVSQPFYISLLRKEYEILSRLQHPSVVKAVAIEQVEGIGLCIVEEYISGVTLDKVKASCSMRRQFFMQLVDCVEYIHSQQVVHRDLKPQNIIVTHNGKNVKIIDFGLADTDNFDILKQPAGTPAYASPEQKSTPLADVRNDIYSLGVILRNMRLGLLYKLVTRHCLCDIKERYRNVAALKEDMNKVRMAYLLSRIFFIAFITFFIVLYFLVTPDKSYPTAVNVELHEVPEQDTGCVAPQPDTEVNPVEESTERKLSLYGKAYAVATSKIDAMMNEQGYDSLQNVIDNMPLSITSTSEEYTNFIDRYTMLTEYAWHKMADYRDEWEGKLTEDEFSSLNMALIDYIRTNYTDRLTNSLFDYGKRKQESKATLQAD